MISLEQWQEIGVFLRSLGDPSGFAEAKGLREALSHYLSLLLAKNEAVNLTAIKDAETGIWKHIADSLALSQWEPLGTVVDWGSGGGLPGIPLALARKAVGDASPVYFVDSVGKKVNAIEEFGHALGLSSCRFFHARGEELITKGLLGGVDTIVMRAVAPAERAIHWLHPSIPRWVLFLGPLQRETWNKEEKKLGRKGLRFAREVHYALPRAQGDRILLEVIKS